MVQIDYQNKVVIAPASMALRDIWNSSFEIIDAPRNMDEEVPWFWHYKDFQLKKGWSIRGYA